MSLKLYWQRKKFWVGDFLHGAPMWRQFVDVSRIIKDPEGSLRHRREMLQGILSFSKKNTAFYSRVQGDALTDFPVINKQSIIAAPDEFRVSPDRIPGQVGAIHVQKTSGSTGIPFEILQDTVCRTRRIATIKAANELIGFHSFMPLMHLRAVKHYWGFPDDLTYKKDLNILYADNANLSDEKIERILTAINDYGIRFVRGYMTTLNTLTEYAVNNGIELKTHPTFISGGELLLDSLRCRIVNDLHCNVISQYANEESGVLGQSELNQSGRNIRLYLANCFCEILKISEDTPAEEGELGRIVVTDYTNRAMPMIRYEVGDLAVAGSKTSDGEVTTLTDLAGRKTDLIYKTNGCPIDMFNSISPEIYNNPTVRQWQFIQVGETSYELKLCVLNKEIEKKSEHFKSLIRDVLGDSADVSVTFVSEIPVLLSGKRKVVIQAWKR